ncbi:MAG: succinate dehydrogenase assembly factor 2 [Acetobacteraceae bacterium]|nr:succinate dehydrogenase assembly factor 2 [Acetobacteraceae bacterium]MSP30813.1 succinate dehydrogenase assembly factor 2 [Acetobacteraceae bacterium]
MREPEPDFREPIANDVRRRRLLYRASHRGTYENDLLLGSFVASRLAEFSDVDLDVLEALLELPDVDLADYLTGRRAIPPEDDSPMLRRIKEAAEAGEARP